MNAGFDPTFLGADLHTPSGTDGPRLDYTHFSVAMNLDRRLAWWSAWNVDGLAMLPGVGRDRLAFRPDPRVPTSDQTTDAVYANNRLDRGHIARRADVIRGTLAEAEQANLDSFYFTNITPQMDDFNQSSRGGVWGNLENAALAFAQADRRRLSIFGGPVLAADDIPYRGLVLVPREFWKIIVYTVDGALRARAFILTQKLELGTEATADPFAGFQTFEVSVDEIATRTTLTFDALLATTPKGTEAAGPIGPAVVESVESIAW